MSAVQFSGSAIMEVLTEERFATVTHRELFEHLKSKGHVHPKTKESQLVLLEYVLTKGHLQNNCPIQIRGDITNKINSFTSRLYTLWNKCSGRSNILYRTQKHWLESEIQFDLLQPAPSTSRGRPEKRFEESSHRSKSRKVEDLTRIYSSEQIAHAAEVSLRRRGKRNAAYLVREAVTSPKRATKIKRMYVSPNTTNRPYTPEEALNLMVRMKLSKSDYQIMRNGAKSKGVNLYPSYNKIREAKRYCYPKEESIRISDNTAEVRLQGLLDHTSQRIINTQEVVIEEKLQDIHPNSLKIIYKWGCDGSSNHSNYKQVYQQPLSATDDSNVFVSSLVPIQLCGLSARDKNTKIILWQNPRPSSTRYCRPIRFQFVKETDEVTRKEINDIESQVEQIIPTEVACGQETLEINHELVLTMVDGKVCNSITETSSQKCYICGATPKDMNKLSQSSSKPSDSAMYKFGLSTLHAWIRFFECLLHISYRLDIKKWQVRDSDDKQRMSERKRTIQKEFRNRMGLIVDQPKQVSGNSNDGNTARRFFLDPHTSSSITGIDVNLIERFGVILRTMSSGYEIDTEKFEKYACDTAKLYVDLYSWCYMPASIHKVLIHGAEVIKTAILPIGQLSEEAMETRNKDFRHIRQYHTRKCSRANNNEDLLHALLISSDPQISSLIPSTTRKSEPFSPEVMALLLAPSIVATSMDSTSSDDLSD